MCDLLVINSHPVIWHLLAWGLILTHIDYWKVTGGDAHFGLLKRKKALNAVMESVWIVCESQGIDILICTAYTNQWLVSRGELEYKWNVFQFRLPGSAFSSGFRSGVSLDWPRGAFYILSIMYIDVLPHGIDCITLTNYENDNKIVDDFYCILFI